MSDLTSTSASGVSSSASSKVLRIAQQIELLKISSKNNGAQSTAKPSMGSMGKHDPGTLPENAPLPVLGTSKAHQEVALILQKAKNRRLASAHGNDDKENLPPPECIQNRAKDMPDFVTF